MSVRSAPHPTVEVNNGKVITTQVPELKDRRGKNMTSQPGSHKRQLLGQPKASQPAKPVMDRSTHDHSCFHD